MVEQTEAARHRRHTQSCTQPHSDMGDTARGLPASAPPSEPPTRCGQAPAAP